MQNINPLFAVDAQYLIDKGNYNEAIEICQKGIDCYPFYISAYIILSKAYLANGEFKKALEVININPEIIEESSDLRKLKGEIEKALFSEVKNNSKSSDNPKTMDFLKTAGMKETIEKSSYNSSDPELIPGMIFKKSYFKEEKIRIRSHLMSLQEPEPFPDRFTNNNENNTVNGNKSIDFYDISANESRDTIQDIARQLKSFSSSGNDYSSMDSEKPEDLSKPIITETMAKIYIQQGIFDKAAVIYEQLSDLYPEKSEYYYKMAEDLKKRANEN